MKRRNLVLAITAATSLSGCVGNEGEQTTEQNDNNETENSAEESEADVESEPEGAEEPEETEEPAPAEFEITDLSVDPSEVSPGESVTLTATVQNVGGTEGETQVDFDIEGETVTEQNVGDSTFEEVTESETVTEQATIPAGETSTVSVSVSRELEGSFSVSVSGRSVTFEVIREYNEIGESYEGAGGLTVTLESFDLNEKSGSYEYVIEYTLENETEGGIDEGGFQLYPADPDNDPLQQYGGFDELFPGDSVSRTYTFEKEKSVKFDMLAYHPDQFFSQSPPTDALIWPVEY